jgi:hypothetical protein
LDEFLKRRKKPGMLSARLAPSAHDIYFASDYPRIKKKVVKAAPPEYKLPVKLVGKRTTGKAPQAQTTSQSPHYAWTQTPPPP